MFWLGAQTAALANEHPEWTPAEWLADQECYRDGILKVAEMLFNRMSSSDEKSFTLSALKDRVLGLNKPKEIQSEPEGDDA